MKEELFNAVLKGDVARVRDLASLGQDVNVTNTKGFSALNIATEHGHLDCVKALVECGASVLEKDNQGYVSARPYHGYLPIHTAVRTGCIDILRYFIEDVGMDVNIATFQCPPPLHLAVANDNFECFDYLIGKGAKLGIGGAWKAKLLCELMYPYNIEMTERLIQQGLDIHSVDEDDNSLLHVALIQYAGRSVVDWHAAVNFVRYLIGKGVDPFALNIHGRTATDESIKNNIFKRAVLDDACQEVKRYMKAKREQDAMDGLVSGELSSDGIDF